MAGETRSDPGNMHQKDERDERAYRQQQAALAAQAEANSPEAKKAERMRLQALEEAGGDAELQGVILARLQAEDEEANMTDQEKELRQRLAQENTTDDMPQAGSSLTEALAAAAGEVLSPEGYNRVGECIFRWALVPSEDPESDDLNLLFQVLIDGEDDAGLINIDVTQSRLRTWRKGLQTIGGEAQFAGGLMEKLLQVATARMADNLSECLGELAHGPLKDGGHKDEATSYAEWYANQDEPGEDD